MAHYLMSVTSYQDSLLKGRGCMEQSPAVNTHEVINKSLLTLVVV